MRFIIVRLKTIRRKPKQTICNSGRRDLLHIRRENKDNNIKWHTSGGVRKRFVGEKKKEKRRALCRVCRGKCRF